MHDAEARPTWDRVLVFDLSRFCRNVGDATHYENFLNDHNIKLISVTQQFSDSTEGFLAKGMTNVMNEVQSRNTSEMTHAGMMVKANKAGHCGGIPALGYDLDPTGKLVVNEHEAEIVRKIFDLFEMNYSYQRMAQVLNQECYTTKIGTPFNKYSFNEILTREKYTGVFTWNQARQKNSKGRHNSHQKKPLEKQVRINDGCPQIITPEQFQRVQERLAARANGRAESKRRHHYMLSGLKILKCAECGSYMIGTTRSSHGTKYTTYYCPQHKDHGCPTKEIRTEHIDRFVLHLICKDLYHRDDHKAISTKMKHSNETKKLAEKSQGLERAIARLIKAIETGYSETLVTRLNQLEAEKAALDSAIAKGNGNNPGITAENKKPLIKKLAKYLLRSDDPDVKQFLTESLDEVLISNSTVSVKMKIA